MGYIRGQGIEGRIQDYKKRLRELLSPARYRHSLATQKVAIDLARYYNLDVDKVSVAGLLHDCGKGLSYSEAEAYIQDHQISLDEIEKEEPQLWHGPVGAHMAQVEFGIDDPEVLMAIRFHSTAQRQMSQTAKIIYVADYIEPNRHFKGIEQIQKIALKDLNMATLLVLNHKLSYLLNKKALIHPVSIEVRNNILRGFIQRHEGS